MGKQNDKDRVERPHISFPVASAMTLVTEPDGNDDASNDTWGTETTYSFLFCASSIDLATWKVTYPFEMDVQNFWRNSPLRLVIYEKSEQQRDNDYLFELQLQYRPNHQQVDEIDAIFQSSRQPLPSPSSC